MNDWAEVNLPVFYSPFELKSKFKSALFEETLIVRLNAIGSVGLRSVYRTGHVGYGGGGEEGKAGKERSTFLQLDRFPVVQNSQILTSLIEATIPDL